MQQTDIPRATEAFEGEEGFLIGRGTKEDVLSRKNYKAWWREFEKKAAIKSQKEWTNCQIADSVRIELYLGTWCSDSREQVPAWVAFLEEKIPETRIEYYFLGRDKLWEDPKTRRVYRADKVPTLLFYEGEKEIFRIIEKMPAGTNFQKLLIERLCTDRSM